ncbi:MAG TPA: hypothetical protein VK421_17560 [Pyrinomonadaceae bacterium]|nr:hypothetical protein [Pyrinomonadaceae bacterium]
MTDTPEARAMLDFLRGKVIRDPSLKLDEDTALVSSGLLDSFAMIDVLLELERVTKRRIPASRVSPQDLETVRQMITTAYAVGVEA